MNKEVKKTGMKRGTMIVLLMCLSLAVSEVMATDTRGTNFMVVFGWVGSYRTLSDATNNVSYSVNLTAEEETDVELLNSSTGYSSKLKLQAGTSTDVQLPAEQVFVSALEQAQGRSVQIISTKPISVVAHCTSTDFGGDATLVLPNSCLSNNYIVQTGKGYTTIGITHQAWLMVVAVAGNTKVGINPTQTTTTGHKAGGTFTVTLNKGEVYMVAAKGTESLDGSKITSNKPIAVYSGNTSSRVPSNANDAKNPHTMFDVTYPTINWGCRFILPPSAEGHRTIVKLTALVDNTQIRMRGNVIATINARETYEYVMFNSQGATYIETSSPTACYQYVSLYDNSGQGEQNNLNSEPSYMWITPMEQRKTDLLVPVPKLSSDAMYYINIVVPTSDVESVVLDGIKSISNQFRVCEDEPLCSYAIVPVATGQHILSCKGGAVAYVSAFSAKSTYAFAAESKTEVLNYLGTLHINYAKTLKEDVLCEGMIYEYGDDEYSEAGEYIDTIHNVLGDTISTLNLRAGKPSETEFTDTICWGDIYRWDGRDYSNEDDYTYLYTNTDGCDSLVTFHLKVLPMYSDVKDTIRICSGEKYVWEGDEYKESGTYTKNLHTKLGCDSIVTLVLMVGDAIHSEFDAYTCPLSDYVWDGRYYAAAGDHNWTYVSQSGCDSVVTMHLRYFPTYKEDDYRLLCDNESLTWEGDTYTAAGDYEKTLKSVNGCDSIVTLHIALLPTYKDTIVDTIISGETYLWDNRTYRQESQEGYFPEMYKTVDGCDSLVTLHLYVNDLNSATIAIADECADVEVMNIDVEVNRGWFDHVSLHFDTQAAAAGFQDAEIDCSTTSTSVPLVCPANLRAGRYKAQATLMFHGRALLTRDVNFMLLYPSSVIEQVDIHTLAILTKAYNGGYDFVSCQWYENGQEIAGANRFYLRGELSVGSAYTALLTDDRGVELMSCPFYPDATTDISYIDNDELSIYPTVAQSGQMITLSREADILVLDIGGKLVESMKSATAFTAPWQQGIYQVVISDGKSRKVKRLMVVGGR